MRISTRKPSGVARFLSGMRSVTMIEYALLAVLASVVALIVDSCCRR